MKILSSKQVRTTSFDQGLPFPHVVLDGLFRRDFCEAVCEALPTFAARSWTHYDNPLEKKSVYRMTPGETPLPPIRELFSTLGDDGFVSLIEQITDIDELVWDDAVHAAGLCVTSSGGKLDLHRDAEVHPHKPLRRAVTAVLFLNDWPEEYGGQLEFWSERDDKPFTRENIVQPKAGRLVLFDPSGYHGYPDLITCPEGEQRKTVQCFYWVTSQDKSGRQRACFSPRPHDKPDENLDRLRRERAIFK